ncbi:30S ribosomal protein S20 [Rosistilla ulvae]|uniref:Small ribosomal subunit protein bS20 n=1 Tax=Rosistilla ulvae TaxID=1930277 RepID=A0A517LWM9_9BACT|nr:30S ribosomal protein S20 [Rosistilla ulvae]QDS87031.1 30S ribosomal protein S20 [Rosistilla ulvae]
MPNSEGAKKRLRQSFVRRDRNKAIKTAMRNQIRKVRESVQAGDFSAAEEQFRLAAKRLDRAGAKNIIHRNAAARTKSRLQHLIKTAKLQTA